MHTSTNLGTKCSPSSSTILTCYLEVYCGPNNCTAINRTLTQYGLMGRAHSLPVIPVYVAWLEAMMQKYVRKRHNINPTTWDNDGCTTVSISWGRAVLKYCSYVSTNQRLFHALGVQ